MNFRQSNADMRISPDTQEGRNRELFAGRVLFARYALGWENLWPAIWPALGVIGIFAAIAMFDLLPMLPGWAHGAVLDRKSTRLNSSH